MTANVLEFALMRTAEGKKVALVTVTSIVGSSPATPGQMMAVLADGTTSGTVGGGASEHKIMTGAIEAMKNGDNVFSLFIDHAETGMTCGGSMEVFGNILGNKPGLCIFGGGHISQCLAKIADQVGFSISVIEDRAEYSGHFNFANYILCKTDEYDNYTPNIQGDYAVICTRGHSTDMDALRYCMKKNFKYIGMIGSKKKVAEIFSSLLDEGIEHSAFDKVYAPVGLDIANTSPEEIAIAIFAEILLIKNNGNMQHKRLS